MKVLTTVNQRADRQRLWCSNDTNTLIIKVSNCNEIMHVCLSIYNKKYYLMGQQFLLHKYSLDRRQFGCQDNDMHGARAISLDLKDVGGAPHGR
jgi:hypothetical protein